MRSTPGIDPSESFPISRSGHPDNRVHAVAVRADPRVRSGPKERSKRSQRFGGVLFRNEVPGIDRLAGWRFHEIAPSLEWLEYFANCTLRRPKNQRRAGDFTAGGHVDPVIGEVYRKPGAIVFTARV